jgi:hypothetical protein
MTFPGNRQPPTAKPANATEELSAFVSAEPLFLVGPTPDLPRQPPTANGEAS